MMVSPRNSLFTSTFTALIVLIFSIGPSWGQQELLDGRNGRNITFASAAALFTRTQLLLVVAAGLEVADGDPSTCGGPRGDKTYFS